MDPTHQSDSRAKLIRTADANTTPRIEDHSIPPASSGAVPDYQTNSTRWDSSMATPSPREFFFPPHGQGGWPSHLDMCLCMVASTIPFLLHRPSLCGSPLGSFCSPFAHATQRQCHLVFVCVCAGFPAIQKSRPITLPRRLNVSNQHGSHSARTAETQHLMGHASPARADNI